MLPGSLRISPVFQYPARAILENDTSRSELAQKGFVMRHLARWVFLSDLVPGLVFVLPPCEALAELEDWRREEDQNALPLEESARSRRSA
jgi:hypothetical protein